MDKTEELFRVNLSNFVRTLVARELECGNEVPKSMLLYYLKDFNGILCDRNEHGCEREEELLEDFVSNLEDVIAKCPPAKTTTSNDVALNRKKQHFVDAYEKQHSLRKEYDGVLKDLISVLNEVESLTPIVERSFKEAASLEELKLDVIEGKVECLKMQCLSNVYKEVDGVAQAHLKLHDMLLQRKEKAEGKLYDLHEKEKKYNELIKNTEFLDVLSKNNKLILQKKRLEYIAD